MAVRTAPEGDVRSIVGGTEDMPYGRRAKPASGRPYPNPRTRASPSPGLTDTRFDTSALTVSNVNCRLTLMSGVPSVQDLGREIDRAGASSLERLSAAVLTAEELRELADRLVDRYVQAARAEQRSWSQIGEALGVTKQAAQKRFVAPVPVGEWPGMSEAAANLLGRAVAEARALGHRYLGTEHLLLALAAEEGLAGTALRRLGVSSQEVGEQIRRIIGTGHTGATATLGITPRTKRVLEAARKEARRLGHRCADSEHLLVAVSENEGVAEQILRGAGAEPGRVRDELADLLAREAPETAARLRTPARRRLRGPRR